MKITQEERRQFRSIFADISSITDPGLVRTTGVVMVPLSTIERLERSYMMLGRMGFYDKLRKLMDEVTK